MSGDGWITLGVVTVAVAVLVRDLVPPAATFLAAVVVLLVADVVTPQQAFSGFSNPAPVTVAALYVLARAVERSGALQPLVHATLGSGGSLRWALARLTAPVAAASAFFNNTPIIAMLTPQIEEWAEKRGSSASRFLMPVSFAAILGGMTTLIGTSTNLVVSGLLEAEGHEPFTMFELTPIALPVAAAGLLLTIALSPKLLPDRRSPRMEVREGTRNFTVRMRVVEGGKLDGKTVEEGGFAEPGVPSVVEVERDGEWLAAVSSATMLRGEDLVTFAGRRMEDVLQLHERPGLVSAQEAHFPKESGSPDHEFFEAVVAQGSPLVGRTLADTRFSSYYQAVVLAIHRAGEMVRGRLAYTPLRPGDTLLMIADSGFGDRWRDRADFVLAARMDAPSPRASRRAGLVLAVAGAIVVGAGLGVLPILHLSLIGALAVVGMGVLRPGEAKDAIDFDVIVVIGAAFGLAAAVEGSGLGQAVADVVAGTLGGFGPQGALAGIVLATVALSSVITNNAAAALVLPIALSTATDFGIDPRTAAVAVALSASASFMTPVSYQTNLMVYGPGGYRFGDYLRLGTPLVLAVLAVILATMPS